MRIENLDKNTNKLRYFIAFSYNGASFFGFQIQPNEISVQETLEKALSVLLRENIKITGAGRTDTGVHAKKMYAHFETSNEPGDQLVHKLNSFLPPSIAVQEIFQVSKDLHARFSALYRTYEYYISLKKNPFTENSAWQLWRKKLDLDAMNRACEVLFQYKDFTSFAKLHTDNKTNFCEMKKAVWEQRGEELVLTISADRFLRNMVRAIVGTMVDVGTGKIKPEDIHDIIEKKNRNAAGTSAPAHGLYLVDVGYNFDN
ncbi:TPA: tRNA pseudouridine(38-40) synthase TruA [Elizabethkingia anophelis]|uniref:tRNA pseudouridine(38-40) synthase TruA n=1 Tax=Elizabethkingia anophelis TaxID=1117645 RepID=UPI000B350AA8|nr:tRNA pseudouridine(38-40) synthase TruA [Elizabethkingia anophelis]MCT3898556.1 tRNA pseudouridine(38-40) synthase TruA [Elizabethkingia anophelis]MCT4326685.1 tRNA pseudouridine(38-40) synthase TruA [Elizabethkingia anophelis]